MVIMQFIGGAGFMYYNHFLFKGENKYEENSICRDKRFFVLFCT